MIQIVDLLLILFHTEERRLCNIHLTLVDQLRHKAVEEGQHQRTDMSTVNVRISHDDDLMITQFVNIEIILNTGTKSGDHSANFGIAQNTVQSGFFHVQDLAAQRQNSLRLSGTGALG